MPRFWIRYIAFVNRFAVLLTIASLVLAVACGFAIRRLHIYSDFKRMLPEQYDSVIQLNRIEQRVRSTSTLQVIIGGDDWPSLKHFIDDFVARVPVAMGDTIGRVEYNTRATSDFFDVNKYLYADVPDLLEIYRRMKRQIDYEKIKESALYVEFGDAPTFDMSDLEAKYKKTTANYQNFREGYFTNADATLAVIMLQPTSGATDVEYAKQLLARVRGVLDDMHPTNYHPSIKYTFAGRYPSLITEFQTVVGDMEQTLGLCVVLIGLVVFIYFRKIRMGALMICTAGLGTMLALASARLVIGYLTAQTAFLGSIILGNGINFSIIFMARYLEERRERHAPPLDALHIALQQTWLPTLATACTNMVAYGVLGLTDIRGLSQFGFIGALGMLFCWIITYATLPAWLLCTERIWPIRFAPTPTNVPAHPEPFHRIMQPLGRWITGHATRILTTCSILLAISIVAIIWYLPNSLEYNFDNLRFETHEDPNQWETMARGKTGQIFGQSATPVVLLADREEQAPLICQAIETTAAGVKTSFDTPMLDHCTSLFTYVPAQQPEKLRILESLRGLLTDNTVKFLSDSQKAEVDKFRKTSGLRPITRADLPDTILERFREADGREGLVVYAYPMTTANLWDGRELVKFSNLIRTVKLANNEVIHASGEYVIFSDLLQAVTHEGPLATGLSFLGVVGLVCLTFRRQRHSARIIIGSLTLGILWMIALLPLFHVKFNFLNFVALPISFGIGVDYSINIYQRYLQEGKGSLATVIRQVGGAVLLCSLTTIIGYAVLLISSNRGLVSLGLAALLGEITCIASALIAMPAYLRKEELR